PSLGRPGSSRTLHSLPTRRSSDLAFQRSPGVGDALVGIDEAGGEFLRHARGIGEQAIGQRFEPRFARDLRAGAALLLVRQVQVLDRKSTRLNSSHVKISYAVFCLK